jgi:hypothetical protein
MSAAVCAAVALGLALIAGCGDDDAGYSPSADTDLTITVDPDGARGEAAQEARIACPGANSPQGACQAIEELPDDPGAPVPPNTPCTEIYGGPDVVTIEGELDGDEIDTRLTRENGCEIERFDRFVPLLEALIPDYEPGAAAAP